IMPAKEAGYKALRDSGSSVITSVAIMAGCCLSVSLVTTNKIVAEITMMIARGSIISGILVMVLLPALLVLCTGNKKLKKVGKLEAKKLKSKEKRERKNDKKSQQIEQPAI
ncbi:MAG: MMPL family transporter, partial [Clostridia bacterium]